MYCHGIVLQCSFDCLIYKYVGEPKKRKPNMEDRYIQSKTKNAKQHESEEETKNEPTYEKFQLQQEEKHAPEMNIGMDCGEWTDTRTN